MRKSRFVISVSTLVNDNHDRHTDSKFRHVNVISKYVEFATIVVFIYGVNPNRKYHHRNDHQTWIHEYRFLFCLDVL